MVLIRENKLKEEDLDIKNGIIDFFKKQDTVDDDKIHTEADKLGIDAHTFEKYIYEILLDILKGGGNKLAKEEDVNKDELKMGIEVEKEHTTFEEVAKIIALAHLAELDDYYTRLKEMESK